MTKVAELPVATRQRWAEGALRKLAQTLLDPDVVPSTALLREAGELVDGPAGEERLLRAMLQAELEQAIRWFARELAH